MPTPTFETILLDVADEIATITLNRPERLNAFTTQMMLDLIAAFDATDADDGVKAVIVPGAGRGFWPGEPAPSIARGAIRSGSPPGWAESNPTVAAASPYASSIASNRSWRR